ncbi:endonuclease/exonuclease/phosphatase family protein [Microbulbifer sp. GL-2]|uniref:endonuclease/exonuclease/phosphatase family protein n=1 Tax=Microbulbifer sp. GL-2 TaxID=2591606 RepID=UPI0011804728|nr:endonuclease/exonuclease/phosphatase family protein [Microbulbifer sp. GL-2]
MFNFKANVVVLLLLSFISPASLSFEFTIVTHNIWDSLATSYDITTKKDNGLLNCSKSESSKNEFDARFEAYLAQLDEVIDREKPFIIGFQEAMNRTKYVCDKPFIQEVDEYFSPNVVNRFYGLVSKSSYGDKNGGFSARTGPSGIVGIYKGEAVVTNVKIEDEKYLELTGVEGTDTGAIALFQDFGDGKNIWFVTAHFVWDNGDVQKSLIDAKDMIRQFKAEFIEKPAPVIFVGDFNIDYQINDQYNKLIEEFEKEFPGVVDITQHIANTKHNASKNSPEKIDYIFYYSPEGKIEPKVDQVVVGEEFLSTFNVPAAYTEEAICVMEKCTPDHKMIWAKFEWID